MSELIIRTATEKDIDSIVKLEELCFTVPWSKDALYHDMTENEKSLYIVAEVDGRTVGYMSLWIILDEGHINNVAVLPEYRNRHIGSAIIDTMLRFTQEAGVKSHTLEVRAGNEAARGLYDKFGFRQEGLRKGYYEDNGEDAVIMWRYSQA